MDKKEFYIDSCIWLNLFKKEGNPAKGIPYWELTKYFIKMVEEEEDIIIVSTIVLKELSFTLEEIFEIVKHFLKMSRFIKMVKTTNEDYSMTRIFERQHKLLSFYDYLHVAIVKRFNAVLITRDSDLIDFAKNYVDVFKPEELLH